MSKKQPSKVKGSVPVNAVTASTPNAGIHPISGHVMINETQDGASSNPTTSATPEPKHDELQVMSRKVLRKGFVRRITGLLRPGGKERMPKDVPSGTADPAGTAGIAGDVEPISTSANQPSVSTSVDVVAGTLTAPGQGTGSRPREAIADENSRLTVGEMTRNITVSSQQKDGDDKEALNKWLVASREVLTGGISTATGVGVVIGPIIAILKLIESDIAVDKRWNKARDTIKMHLEYVEREIGTSAGTAEQVKDSPRERFTREYANELSAIFKTYFADRGVNEDDLIQGDYAKILGYYRRAGRALTSTVHIAKIDDILARMTEALQNYERNKTTYIVDATYQLLHANIDRLLRPFRSDAQQLEANGRQHTKCHEETRMAILHNIREWARSSDGPSFYLLTDAAGLGKSTVAYTLSQEWRNTRMYLGASFFFSRGNAGTSTPLDFMRHVAWSLMQSYPQVKHHTSMSYDVINQALDSHSLEDQWNRLVSTPLSILVDEAQITNRKIVLIIDALDECLEDQRGEFLRLLLRLPGDHVKVFMTSRPGHDVESLLGEPHKVTHNSLEDQEFNAADLRIYVADRFKGMKMSLDEANTLSEYSGGLFIFAATVCDLLQKSVTRKRLLKKIIEDDEKPANKRLEQLYMDILKPQLDGDCCSKDAIQNVFRIILAASRSLTVGEIKELLGSADELDVARITRGFSSVLQCGTSDEEPVYIRHPTFREFMLDPKRSGEYGVTLESAHELLAISCLSLMAERLQQNMCHIDANVSFEEHESALDLAWQLQDHVDSAVLYSASNWIFHTIQSWRQGNTEAQVQRFLETKLLNWIELGAVGGWLTEFMRCIHQLGRICGNIDESNARLNSQWCHDILEFLRQNQTLLSHFPLHVYSSALTFTPRESRVHQVYSRASLPRIVSGHPTRTSGTSVLMRHRNPVDAVTYSADGEILVSAAYGGDVVVWDARTGARHWDHKLEREGGVSRGICTGVRVLPGNRVIVSIWTNTSESQNYTRLYRLDCERKGLLCPGENLDISGESVRISWAPDLSGFACGTVDGMVHLFMLGGQLQRISSIKAHEGNMTRLSFSHDGLLMISASKDKTIKVWSVTSEGLAGPTASWKHTKQVVDGAFSPVDSSLFAFVDKDSLHIYNIRTNTADLICDCGEFNAHGMAYSHDGKQIAVRGPASCIRIINTVVTDQNTALVMRLLYTHHNGHVTCLAFSHDDRHLVTGSYSSSLNIHELASAAPRTTMTGHRDTIRSLSFSLDGMSLASADNNGNLCIWDVESGNLTQDAVQTGVVLPMVARSSDGSIVACATWRNLIRFWSVETKRYIGAKLLLGYPKAVDVEAMVFSPDDTKLAMITSKNQIVLIDMQTTHNLSIQLFITVGLDFNPDGMILAFHPNGDYICCGNHAWDFTRSPTNRVTGDLLSTILGETFPLLRIDKPMWRSHAPSILLGSPTRQVFYIPPDLNFRNHAIHDGCIALGAVAGRVMILDFSHLATEQETALLDCINAMRRETAARSGPSRLYEVLSSYSGPRKIVINVNHVDDDSDWYSETLDDEDEDGHAEDEEVEGQESVDEAEDNEEKGSDDAFD